MCQILTAEIRILEKVWVYGHLAVIESIVWDTASTLVGRINASLIPRAASPLALLIWEQRVCHGAIHVRVLVRRIQLPSRKEFHVTAVKTIEWKINGPSTVDIRRSARIVGRLSCPGRSTVVECIVLLASRGDRLEARVPTSKGTAMGNNGKNKESQNVLHTCRATI